MERMPAQSSLTLVQCGRRGTSAWWASESPGSALSGGVRLRSVPCSGGCCGGVMVGRSATDGAGAGGIDCDAWRRCLLASPVSVGVLAPSVRLSAEEGTVGVGLMHWGLGRTQCWGIGDKLARGPMPSSATENADASNRLSYPCLSTCLFPCLFYRRRPARPWTYRSDPSHGTWSEGPWS